MGRRRTKIRHRRLRARHVLFATEKGTTPTNWSSDTTSTTSSEGVGWSPFGVSSEYWSFIGPFNLQMFPTLVNIHWCRWTREVEQQRVSALAVLSRTPTSQNLDILIALETLSSQMKKV